MSADFKWGDPPPAHHGRRGPGTRVVKFVTALKANPGRWAQYRPGYRHTGSGAYLKKRYGLEVTTRARPDKGFDIWARWNPEEGSASRDEKVDAVLAAWRAAYKAWESGREASPSTTDLVYYAYEALHIAPPDTATLDVLAQCVYAWSCEDATDREQVEFLLEEMGVT